ncbi:MULTISPECIES: amino acid ABC transporter permease [Rhizobium/Agrobacterium group]|uniref:ABC transporter permease n=3 Tax=Rhizobium/Agrobacterium group TaxID=227290 RepID=A0ABR5CKC3_9HYPH|nr:MULTISPECIES: amino acid ABC transporter permease [Rhizobium/Agrobacterium group]ACM30981.1 conserved hypothetical protein [Rhizobium rhizogenes K84]AYM84877.1 amino acid ABC transporter permease [Agrobacterium tumefaciens]KJF65325.1 ABC transporter permease [Rhizobium nepotum 39/7]MQB08189.1 amino acid ABC transporter permease [Agrobacterium tumefaciens]NTE95109.1 amino acid ABC transporter permease [Agrobacterium tumefaciens]
MTFDVYYMFRIIPSILYYLPITIYISVVAMIIAAALGLGLSVMLQANRLTAAIARVYISFFRGTPVLVQLLIIYFGLPQLFPAALGISPVNAVIIGLGLHTAAYLAEIFRAALAAVGPGQKEAALSIGLTPVQAFTDVVARQAIRHAIPPTGNIFIGLVKNSSLAFTLGVTEVLAQSKLLASENLKFFEAYFAAGLVYWAFTILYTFGQDWLERYLNRPYDRLRGAVVTQET